MLAAWYEKIGAAEDVFCVDEMETPTPADGEVLIRLKSSGVNPSDVKMRAGSRGPSPFPRVIPHSDGAGIIEAVGKGVPEGRVGERVWTYNAGWQRAFGTAAQYVTLPSEQAVSLPENASYAAAACLGIPAMTAHRCVLGDGAVTGQTVLVTGGAGAVGHFAIQLAKKSGATVITTVSGQEKAVFAESASPDHVLNYKTDDVAAAVMELTDGAGVDRVVEVEFGGNLDVTSQIIKPHGTISAYASQAVMTPELPFYTLMFKAITLRMVLVYVLTEKERQDAATHINDLLTDDNLDARIAESLPLEEIARAHTIVESGETMGNVVLEIP